jgi:hypothetical protein
MTAGPSSKSTECNREEARQALCAEALIKQLEVAIYSTEILQKAVDVLCKRIASGQISDNMLLRVVVCLSKSSAVLAAAERNSPHLHFRSQNKSLMGESNSIQGCRFAEADFAAAISV